MKSFSHSAEPKRTITITIRSFVVVLYVVALLAQIVAIYGQANAARTQGSSVVPKREVINFLQALGQFGVAAVVAVLVVMAAFYVMRISPAGESSKPERFIAHLVFMVFGALIICVALFLSKGFWQSDERQSMLLVPNFYVALGVIIWLFFGRVKKVRAPRASELRGSTPDSKSSSDATSSLGEMMSRSA